MANAGLSQVSSNYIYGCGGFGINESVVCTHNAYIANYLYASVGGAVGTMQLLGSGTYAIRNVTAPAAAITDTGGFRQTIDGWSTLGVQNGVGNGEMGRIIGRFRVPRGGSVTGLVLSTSTPWTAGNIIAVVFKNSGNAGVGGGPLSVLATIDGTNLLNKAYVTLPQDAAGCTFVAGDELFVVLSVTGWNAMGVASNVYAAIEIET